MSVLHPLWCWHSKASTFLRASAWFLKLPGILDPVICLAALLPLFLSSVTPLLVFFRYFHPDHEPKFTLAVRCIFHDFLRGFPRRAFLAPLLKLHFSFFLFLFVCIHICIKLKQGDTRYPSRWSIKFEPIRKEMPIHRCAHLFSVRTWRSEKWGFNS